MRFLDFYADDRPAISFELFPPRTERTLAELEERLPRLIGLGPSFMTVTYGALGSTRDRTLEVASKIKLEYGMETAHHLTCVGSSRDEITTVLEEIRSHNIENIVALRGDPPRERRSLRRRRTATATAMSWWSTSKALAGSASLWLDIRKSIWRRRTSRRTCET